MAFPDFLLIGAMKCGTSTLAAQLARQPGVFMATPKEPNFFSNDEIYARGVGWYQGLFDSAPPGAVKGEASTHYTKMPTYPDTLTRLSEALEAPKFIYIIRDPLKRAVSHFMHEWTLGGVSKDINAAFATHAPLTDYGRYAYQIAPYVDRYGADAIYLTSLEAMHADRDGTLQALAAHIGVSAPVAWVAEEDQVNAATARWRKLPFEELIYSNPVATALRQRLVPKGLRDRIRKARQMEKKPTLPAAVATRLTTLYREDRAALEAMFPNHPAIAAAYRDVGTADAA